MSLPVRFGFLSVVTVASLILGGCGPGGALGKEEQFHLELWQQSLERLRLRAGDPVTTLDEFMKGKYREIGETKSMGSGWHWKCYLVDDVVQVTATVNLDAKLVHEPIVMPRRQWYRGPDGHIPWGTAMEIPEP